MVSPCTIVITLLQPLLIAWQSDWRFRSLEAAHRLTSVGLARDWILIRTKWAKWEPWICLAHEA